MLSFKPCQALKSESRQWQIDYVLALGSAAKENLGHLNKKKKECRAFVVGRLVLTVKMTLIEPLYLQLSIVRGAVAVCRCGAYGRIRDGVGSASTHLATRNFMNIHPTFERLYFRVKDGH